MSVQPIFKAGVTFSEGASSAPKLKFTAIDPKGFVKESVTREITNQTYEDFSRQYPYSDLPSLKRYEAQFYNETKSNELRVLGVETSSIGLSLYIVQKDMYIEAIYVYFEQNSKYASNDLKNFGIKPTDWESFRGHCKVSSQDQMVSFLSYLMNSCSHPFSSKETCLITANLSIQAGILDIKEELDRRKNEFEARNKPQNEQIKEHFAKFKSYEGFVIAQGDPIEEESKKTIELINKTMRDYQEKYNQPLQALECECIKDKLELESRLMPITDLIQLKDRPANLELPPLNQSQSGQHLLYLCSKFNLPPPQSIVDTSSARLNPEPRLKFVSNNNVNFFINPNDKFYEEVTSANIGLICIRTDSPYLSFYFVTVHSAESVFRAIYIFFPRQSKTAGKMLEKFGVKLEFSDLTAGRYKITTLKEMSHFILHLTSSCDLPFPPAEVKAMNDAIQVQIKLAELKEKLTEDLDKNGRLCEKEMNKLTQELKELHQRKNEEISQRRPQIKDLIDSKFEKENNELIAEIVRPKTKSEPSTLDLRLSALQEKQTAEVERLHEEFLAKDRLWLEAFGKEFTIKREAAAAPFISEKNNLINKYKIRGETILNGFSLQLVMKNSIRPNGSEEADIKKAKQLSLQELSDEEALAKAIQLSLTPITAEEEVKPVVFHSEPSPAELIDLADKAAFEKSRNLHLKLGTLTPLSNDA